jgi:hypothetical protein
VRRSNSSKDSFISGWEEGGEFNAIMSMKVTDKSKIYEIKAHLEANLNMAAIQGELTVDFEKIKNESSKNTETTIAVNWSGGGSIKDPSEAWTIEAMKKAASAFPDLVAITPQRTYAILTKYTGLESFQRQKEKFTLLEYENAKIYTDAMLDHYMDYKMMWKQLALASDELEANRATIEWPQVTEDMYQLAKVELVPVDEFGVTLRQSGQGSSSLPPTVQPPQLHPEGQTPPQPITLLTVAKGLATHEDAPKTLSIGMDTDSEPIPALKPASGSQGVVAEGQSQAVQAVSVPPTDDQARDNQVRDMQRLDGTDLVVITDPATNTPRTLIQFKPFKPTFAGLILASKVCRVEMAKIVNEVDLLTKKPNLAQDTRRDARFLHPLVFKQLLPVCSPPESIAAIANDSAQIVRSWTDDMLSGGTQTSAPIILGYSAPNRQKTLPPVSKLDSAIKVTPEALVDSIKRVERRAADYRMRGCVAQVDDTVGTIKGLENTDFFNDLESLDPTFRPTTFSVWQGPDFVLGIEMRYANGESRSYGVCNTAVPHHRLVLNQAKLKPSSNGLESIFEIRIQKKMDPTTKEIFIGSIAIVTTHFKKLDSSQPANYIPPGGTKALTTADSDKAAKPDAVMKPDASKGDKSGTEITWQKPDDGPWSLRGFFGYQNKTTKTIKLLGVVFGKDGFVPVPEEPLTPALCRRYFELDDAMRQQVESTWIKHRKYPGKFLYGRFLRLTSDANVKKPLAIFDDLGSGLDLGWKLSKLGFANNAGILAGIRMVWSSGRDYSRGNYDTAPEAGKWFVNVDTDLVAAKMTTGQTSTTDPGRIQSVEFIRAGTDHALPSWLLDLSTLRYLGDGDPSKLTNPTQLIDTAPVADGPKWSVRGFYGWTDADKNIVGLGAIWGCG